MFYTANTTQWRKGDIVIHDADAKEPKMLMIVIGYARDGLCKTQYVDERHRRTIYKNEIKYLHDPLRFSINPDLGRHEQALIEKYQDEWLRVKRWNLKHPVGTWVHTTSADGGHAAKTSGAAIFTMSGSAMIHLEPGGMWALAFVAPMR